MVLKRRISLHIGILLILMIGTLLSISYFIVIKNFNQVDITRLENRYRYVEQQLDFELDKMSIAYNEWLFSGERGDVLRKFSDDQFLFYEFNSIMLFDAENKLINGKFYDFDLKEEVSVPVNIYVDVMGNDGILADFQRTGIGKGVMMLDKQPMLAIIHPFKGDVAGKETEGTVIVGKYLNIFLLEKLTGGDDVTINIKSIFSDLPESYKEAYAHLHQKKIHIELENEGISSGYFLYNDFKGKPSFIFKIDTPVSYIPQLQNSLTILISSFIGVALIFYLLVRYGVSKVIFDRIKTMADSIINIRHGNTSRRISFEGQDEITALAFEMNRVLDSFEYSVKKVKNFGDVRYKTLFEQMRDVYYKLDSKGYIRDINPAGVNFFGYHDKKDMIRLSLPLTHYLRPMEREEQVKLLKSHDDVVTYEMEITKKDGSQTVVEVKGRAIFDAQGNFNGEEANLRDISERRQRERRIQLLATVFHNSLEGVVITDMDVKIKEVNQSFSDITGFTKEDAFEKDLSLIINSKPDNVSIGEILGSLMYQGYWTGEIWSQKKTGEDYSIWLSMTAVKGDDATPAHYIAVFHDITASKLSEMKLKYQAYHDSLTQLPNRKLFVDRLEVAIIHARRKKHMVGLMFLDMDNFKQVNDTLGHHVGDLYLIEIADRLKKCCRDEDTVARLGGDEFTVLLPAIENEYGAVEAANRVIEALSQKMVLNDIEFFPSCSIGITLFPKDGENVETLIKNADMAMYQAKEHAKGSFSLFSSQLNSEIMKRVAMERSMRNAIDKDEFVIYYQPIVNIEKGAVSELEALIRWKQKSGEVIAPAQFISLAENSDLIFPIGEWVLKTVCEQGKKWQDMGFEDLGVAVNLTAKQFQDPSLVGLVKDILEETGFESSNLTLEITEETLVKDIDSTIMSMDALKNIGIKISLDDFGTGYSSLSYLNRFPIDNLKIDKSFVYGLPEREGSVALVETILTLAKTMGLNTIAEGVESNEQLHFLQTHFCDNIQGYFFSKPLDVDDMTNFLHFTELAKTETAVVTED